MSEITGHNKKGNSDDEEDHEENKDESIVNRMESKEREKKEIKNGWKILLIKKFFWRIVFMAIVLYASPLAYHLFIIPIHIVAELHNIQ